VQETGDYLKGGGFSRSVRAEHPEDLAFGNGKTQAVNGFEVSVFFCQVLHFDNGHSLFSLSGFPVSAPACALLTTGDRFVRRMQPDEARAGLQSHLITRPF
jgi:hypothetical protein